MPMLARDIRTQWKHNSLCYTQLACRGIKSLLSGQHSITPVDYDPLLFTKTVKQIINNNSTSKYAWQEKEISNVTIYTVVTTLPFENSRATDTDDGKEKYS